MGFLRNVVGTVVSVSLASVVAYATDLQLYALVCFGIQWVSSLYAVPKADRALPGRHGLRHVRASGGSGLRQQRPRVLARLAARGFRVALVPSPRRLPLPPHQ
jgi:hypothetical protein